MSQLPIYRVNGELCVGARTPEGMVFEECDFPWTTIYGPDWKSPVEFLGSVDSRNALMKGKQGHMNDAMKQFLQEHG